MQCSFEIRDACISAKLAQPSGPPSKILAGILLWAMLAALPGPLHAASRMGTPSPVGAQENGRLNHGPFGAEHGRLTVGFQISYGQENNIPHDVSHIHLMFVEPEVGIIAWDSPRSRIPIKRFEVISAGIVGSAYRPGGYLVGDGLLFRLGLRSVGSAVPFIDAGSGPVWTTLSNNAHEISGHLQFLSRGGIGIQFFRRPRRAMTLEYRYFHMSNAGLQEPNHGFNGSMVTIGFCWLGRPRHLLAANAYRHSHHFLHLP